MSPAFYHITHLLGIMFLFVGFGGLTSANGNRRKGMIMHGIGLLILLVSGFGLLAKMQLSYTAHWVIGLYVIWVLLGALPVLGKRGILNPCVMIAVALILGAAAAWLGFLRPTL
jgi:hypothetical protein